MIKLLVILINGVVLMGCAISQTEKLSKEMLQDHVIRLNRDGLMTDPDIADLCYLEKTFAKPLPSNKAQENIQHMLDAAKSLARDKASVSDAYPAQNIKVKLLIHVHGGLNTFAATDQRVVNKAHLIKETVGDDWHYPIFISWPSNAFGTWAENTFLIREGRKTSVPLGILSSPFVITSDIFRSFGKYPITAWYQLVNEKDWAASRLMPSLLSHSWKEARKNYCELQGNSSGNGQCTDTVAQYHPNFSNNFTLNYSDYHSKLWDAILKGGLEAITFPVRLTLGTLWHSAVAVSAWDNMKRRTQNIFFPTHRFDERYESDYEDFSGGEFFEQLLNTVINDKNYEYEITLVGHSMGAMVLNHALKLYQKKWFDSGALKNIVYMAAAASIDDSLDALIPFLVPSNLGQTPPSFYNLTLNRVAEVSETHVFGIIPTGSLLVSIDQHFENPEHPMKRTLGSEVNVLSALSAIAERLKDARGTIVFKAFDRFPGSIPSVHGGFNHIEYWKESIWNVWAQTPIPGYRDDIKRFNAY